MNIEVPAERDMEIDKIYSLFYRGLLSEVEKHRLVIQTWTKVKERIE
jgi:hypothetical protein